MLCAGKSNVKHRSHPAHPTYICLKPLCAWRPHLAGSHGVAQPRVRLLPGLDCLSRNARMLQNRPPLFMPIPSLPLPLSWSEAAEVGFWKEGVVNPCSHSFETMRWKAVSWDEMAP